eukprot:g2921.t1
MSSVQTDSWKIHLKLLIASAHIYALEGRNCYTVIGITGSGKSTLIQVINGRVYVFDRDTWSFRAAENLEGGPRVGHTNRSCTVHSEIFEIQTTDGKVLFMLDEAGSLENRSGILRRWGDFMQVAKFTLLNSIHRIVVVIDCASLTGSKCHTFRKLAKSIADTLPLTAAPFYDSMVFAFNRAICTVTGENLTIGEIRKKFQKLIKDLNPDLKSMEEKQKQGSLEKVDEDLLQELQATILLAKAIDQNPCIVCPAPIGYEACQTMRSGITRLLLNNNGAKSLSSGQLVTAMQESDDGVALEVCLKISKIATDYIRLIDQYFDAVQYFRQLLQEVANDADLNYANWRHVIRLAANLKAERLREKKQVWIQLENNKLNQLLLKKIQILEKISKYEKRTNEVVFHKCKVQKNRPWLFPWITWVEKEVDINLDMPFTRFDVTGKYHSKTISHNSPPEGRLKIVVKSDWASAINAMIEVYAQEKDTPATQELLGRLRKEIQEIDASIENQESLLTWLSTGKLTHKEHFERICEQAYANRSKLQRVSNVLHADVKATAGDMKDFPWQFRERHIMRELTLTLQSFERSGLCAKAFSNAGSAAGENIEAFNERYAKLANLAVSTEHTTFLSACLNGAKLFWQQESVISPSPTDKKNSDPPSESEDANEPVATTSKAKAESPQQARRRRRHTSFNTGGFALEPLVPSMQAEKTSSSIMLEHKSQRTLQRITVHFGVKRINDRQ